VNLDDERALRDEIGARLNALVETRTVVTRDELSSFPMGSGVTRRLVDQSRGIWNPRDLRATLSVLSSPDGPYEDTEVEGGLLRYAYRSGSSDGDNRKLRAAFDAGLPIILLRKIDTGVYVPTYPVYVVHDDPNRREFLLAVDESVRYLGEPESMTPDQRRYAERITRQRLHQPEFRARVLRAYDTRCAVCRLRHGELLDAAHIVGDADTEGTPIVPNGLCLCKIHHAAYDRNLMGIRPDLRIVINARLLEETDGPMLQHGLKEMHDHEIVTPALKRDRPDPGRLELRYETFLATG
jgi:putative restriction endonuclease